MANEENYENYYTSSTYSENDMSDGGEQFASAIYLNEQIKAQTKVIENKQNIVVLQPTEPPLNPVVGDMWIDTSIYPQIIYSWDGSQWNRATTISAEEIGTYTTAQIDNSLNLVKFDVDAIQDRTTVVEGQVADGEGLAQKVTQSTTYQTNVGSTIDGKITGFQGNLADEKWVNDNLPKMVTSSVLDQESSRILAKFTSGGGVNLLKNSVWYGGLLNWQVVSGAASQYIGNDAIESGSGFSIATGVIKQVISVTAGQQYTITSKVKKGTVGTAYMKLSDGQTFQQVDMIDTAAYDFTEIQIAGFIPQTNSLIVEFGATGTTGAIFTSTMVNAGDIGLQWSHANGEMYATGVKFDINGVMVDSSIYDGYTVMSPEEFSGYYRNNQGVMQKVFTLNKDVTEVAKLKVTNGEMEMGSIKAVYIDGGGYRGWSFIPST